MEDPYQNKKNSLLELYIRRGSNNLRFLKTYYFASNQCCPLKPKKLQYKNEWHSKHFYFTFLAESSKRNTCIFKGHKHYYYSFRYVDYKINNFFGQKGQTQTLHVITAQLGMWPIISPCFRVVICPY